MTACPSCTADNPPDARFCNQCGTRLEAAATTPQRQSYTPRHLAERILKTRSAMRGEKKRVTVLFCDIKGSTRLSQQAGAEAWHGILDRFFSLLTSAVHRYEGTVNQYTGDGIMALFGAPIALEDHAQRACFAALEMQRELRRFADELRLSQGLNLTLRVGLNSGEVIVGAIGDDLRMDYTAQGHTVNLAARMEHVCEPGRIYLAADTARQVEGYFALRSLGRMEVAGLDEPVAVFDLEGPGTLGTRLDRSLARGRSRFIGREAETAALNTALDAVEAGQGQVVAVIGEAGIGKSRLCHEFLQTAAERGFEVHRATGVPYANALPFHPIRTLSLSRLGLEGRSNPGEIRRLIAGTLLLEHPEHAPALPAIFDFLGAGDGSTTAPDAAAMTREKLFELLAQFLPCPRERPLVLLIEDLHFLDAGSEEFLQALAASVRAHRALLLLNYRPDYADGWLAPKLDARLAVTALDARQLAELARARLGVGTGLDALADAIGARAGGNPFFVEEAVLSLAEAGHLTGEAGRYVLAAPIAQWPIPDTVHALLAARIDRLPAPSKTLLQTAAVIGEAFVPAVVAAVADAELDACTEALQRLDTAGFLWTVGDQQYEFRHPLMREVAEAQQLDSERRARHARLAAALAAEHPASDNGNAAAVRIAHHWQQAQDWLKAGEWNLMAARWAVTRDLGISTTQIQLALAHLDRAVAEGAAITPALNAMRVAARAGLIRIAQFTPLAHETIERAYQEGRAMAAGDVAGSADLTLSYGSHQLYRGDAERAVAIHREAVSICLAQGQEVLVRRFRLALLLTHFSAGRPREGIALVDLGDGAAWRHAAISEDNFASRGFYSLMLVWLGELPRAQRELEAVLAFSDVERRNFSWMHAFHADFAWFAGVPGDSLHHARRAFEQAGENGGPYVRAITGRSLGRALCMAGQPQDAVALLESLAPLCSPGGLASAFEADHRATLSQAYRGAGRLADARGSAQHGIASARRSGSRVWEIYAWLALLELPADLLEAGTAEKGLARLEALIDSTAAEGFRPFCYEAHARFCTDAEAARGWRRKAAGQFRRNGAEAHAARVLDQA